MLPLFRKILIFITFVIIFSVILTYLFFNTSLGTSSNFITNSLANFSKDPKLEKSLLSITQENAYFRYKNNKGVKISLDKKRNLNGIHFISPTSEMIIDRELFVQFKENTEDVKVKDILRKEGLIIKKKNNWLGQNYLVATSDNAKYID